MRKLLRMKTKIIRNNTRVLTRVSRTDKNSEELRIQCYQSSNDELQTFTCGLFN